MAWAFLELSQRPDCVEKLRNELDPISHLKDDIFRSAVHKSKYLDWFVREVQRVYSVVQVVRKYNTEPVNLLGYDLKKDTPILVFIAGIHTDKEYWQNQNEFDPERWSKPIVSGSFIPFSQGPMKCIGFRFAIAQIKV